jgi:hypothetical protein
MATARQGSGSRAVGSGAGQAGRLGHTSESTPPPAPPASPNGASPAPARFTGYSLRFKLLALVMAAGAVVALTLAYMGMGDDGDAIVQSGGTADVVEELMPARGSQVVAQSTVGIDLTEGWEGTLLIDGQEIPPDEMANDTGLNRVEFTPGDGKVLSALPSGPVCVQAVVWETRTGRTDSSRTVGWCFEVV